MLTLLEDVIIEDNGSKTILSSGTIINEATHTLDEPEIDAKSATQDKMISIVQKWIELYRDKFKPGGWSKVIDILQPAIDAIYDRNVDKLKKHAVALANKVDDLSDNPKSKAALEIIHDLYLKLLGMAREQFNESVSKVIDILTETINKIKTS